MAPTVMRWSRRGRPARLRHVDVTIEAFAWAGDLAPDDLAANTRIHNAGWAEWMPGERPMTPVLRSIDPHLREAAAVLGASPRRVWLAVDLPLVWRALLVAAGFAFAISLGEFGATVVIARADAPTVPIAIARLLARPGTINVAQGFALSVVLMVVTTASVLLVDRWRPKATGGSSWV